MIEYLSFNEEEWNTSVRLKDHIGCRLDLMDWDRMSWADHSSSELAHGSAIFSDIDFITISHNMGEDNKVYIIEPRYIIINTKNDIINEYFATYCPKDRLIHLLISYSVTDDRTQINADILISTALRKKQDMISIFKFLGI